MRRTVVGVPILFGALGTALLLVPHDSDAQRSSRLERQMVGGREAVAREALVRFRDPIQPSTLAAIVPETDPADVERITRAGILRIRSRSLSAAALVEQLTRRPDVVYAEPNFIIRIQATPTDPYFPYLWGLERIQAPAAWDLTTGSTSPVVAVIDTGIDYTHPDLAPNVWSAPTPFTIEVAGQAITCAAGTHGFNVITRSCDPMDDHNHGTHVAGTIGAAGNDGMGVAGVNWTTRVIGIKFLDATGTGTLADAVSSMEFAMAVKEAFAMTGAADVRVLSNSWGGPESSQALLDAINLAHADEMLFVAGAGNATSDNDAAPFYPASYDAPNVVAVAATTLTDGPAFFSNFGRTSVDLSAPGDFILSTTIGNTYEVLSGTSMATPHVAGAAALVLSRCALDTTVLKEVLLGTVDPVPALDGLTVTGGRLNVNSALHACISSPTPPAELTARGADGRVELSWPATLGALRYNVKRSLTAGGPYTPLATGVTGTSYTDSAVVNGTTYYYVLSAENVLGESADSSEASATPNVPADLFIASFDAPVFGGADSTIAVSATTTNQGAGAAGPSVTRFYLSDDSILDPSDTPLGDQHVPDLAPGAAASATVTLAIPAGVATGMHRLIAQADADAVLDESDEANNGLARLFQIGPDLIVQAFAVPATAAAGQTISVSDTISNWRGGAAEASTTTFYFTLDRAIDADDVILGSRDVPALEPGVTNTGTTALTIPATTALGVYYIVAKADGHEVVAETSEINNTSGRPIRIGGDLSIASFTVPATAAPGSTVVVSDTTENGGSAPVSASVTRFYFSANAVLDAGDALLSGSRDVPALEPLMASAGTTTLSIPAATGPGKYYLIAKADADDAVAETYETNNTSARPITIGSNLNIDLVVSSLAVPAEAAAGATIVVTETTANQGSDGAPASVTGFYLSANTLLDSGDVLTGTRQIPELAAGAIDSGSTTLTVPPTTAAGTYYIIAKADAGDDVGEKTEYNNTLPRLVRIGGDLVVSQLAVPAQGGAGASIVVADTTTNQGGGSVGPTATGFYLSTNATLDAADTPLGSRATPELAPGTGHSASTALTLPPEVEAGSYYLIAKADAGGEALETQEANNTLARRIQIGSDLWVPTLTAPAGAAAGASIIVTDTTANRGAGASAPTVTKFYLSADGSLDAGDLLLDGNRAVPALAAGASSTGSTMVVIPAGTAVGRFYLIAQADGDATTPETLETNNTRVRTLSVGPDLVIAAVLLPESSFAAGSVLELTDTVTNRGAGAAAPSVSRFYLSDNWSLDAGDVVLDASRSVPQLAAGASSSGTTFVAIPASTAAGGYYLLVVADGDAGVAETLETNNVRARSVQVTIAP